MFQVWPQWMNTHIHKNEMTVLDNKSILKNKNVKAKKEIKCKDSDINELAHLDIKNLVQTL